MFSSTFPRRAVSLRPVLRLLFLLCACLFVCVAVPLHLLGIGSFLVRSFFANYSLQRYILCENIM